jgi:hypothetical protein
LDGDIANDHDAYKDEIENGECNGISGVNGLHWMKVAETPRSRVLNGVLSEAEEWHRREQNGGQP